VYVESLSLPFVRSRSRVRAGAEPVPTPELLELAGVDVAESDVPPTTATTAAARKPRLRILLAIAASGVFFAGVGSLGMHVAMPMPNSMTSSDAGSSVMTHQMSNGTMPNAAMPGAAMPTAPADAIQMTAPAPDAGPIRPLGPGKAVPASAPAAATAATSASRIRPTTNSSASTGSSTSSSAKAGPSASGASSAATSAGYAVRTGDDFGAIGARFGVSPERIAALNPGVDPTSLSIGQTLRVP
jgi:hypothetical protein